MHRKKIGSSEFSLLMICPDKLFNIWIQSLAFARHWGHNWDQARFSSFYFVSKWPALSCNILWAITWIEGITIRIFLDKAEIVFFLVRARLTFEIFTFGTIGLNLLKWWILVNFDETKVFFEGIFISMSHEKNHDIRIFLRVSMSLKFDLNSILLE